MLYFIIIMACNGDKGTPTDMASPPMDTAEAPAEEVANVEILGGGVEIHSELIGPDAWAVRDAGVGRLVMSGPQTLIKDIRQAEEDVLEWIDGDINAAALYDEWLLLSIGENLWVWNDELWASPMQESDTPQSPPPRLLDSGPQSGSALRPIRWGIRRGST